MSCSETWTKVEVARADTTTVTLDGLTKRNFFSQSETKVVARVGLFGGLRLAWLWAPSPYACFHMIAKDSAANVQISIWSKCHDIICSGLGSGQASCQLELLFEALFWDFWASHFHKGTLGEHSSFFNKRWVTLSCRFATPLPHPHQPLPKNRMFSATS